MATPGYGLAACQNCGEHFEFPQEGIGLSVACPHCQLDTILAIITDEPVLAPESEQITAGELKGALAGVLPRRRVSVFYQLGLLIVAIFMVLLPVAYVAFVVGLGWGTYWYGVHARVLFASFTGGIHVFCIKLIAYFGPLLAGGVAVLFMFKPILARPGRRAEPVELNPAQHPRLYQFIAHLCDLLQVPAPRSICLDCELNASAGFRRGFWSMAGNDMRLTLGLPLAGGLNTRQLAAVVAHELGHCTQGFAMRLGYVINRIDHWFLRVVYERDAWDEALEDWANSVNDWRLSLIVVCVHLAVALSRLLLRGLLHLGQAASCYLSRQMEYHADSCAVDVAGTAGLETLLLRLRELNILQSLAFANLGTIWKKQHRLPDSLPDYQAQLELHLPASFHEQAQQTLLNETAGWFATHPTPAQRIQKARQLAAEGCFNLEKPARWLFNDFSQTARLVTGLHYRLNLQLPVTDATLRPATDFFSKDPVSAE